MIYIHEECLCPSCHTDEAEHEIKLKTMAGFTLVSEKVTCHKCSYDKVYSQLELLEDTGYDVKYPQSNIKIFSKTGVQYAKDIIKTYLQ